MSVKMRKVCIFIIGVIPDFRYNSLSSVYFDHYLVENKTFGETNSMCCFSCKYSIKTSHELL